MEYNNGGGKIILKLYLKLWNAFTEGAKLFLKLWKTITEGANVMHKITEGANHLEFNENNFCMWNWWIIFNESD